MRIFGLDGRGVSLDVDGYQFPDAAEESLRRSWLMIRGEAIAAAGTWAFRWQALTPDEAINLGRWLRDLADERAGHDDLWFLEPNLAFAVLTRSPERVGLRIAFDLEFSPPWRPRIGAGDPFTIETEVPRATLRDAAENWAEALADYP